MDNEYIIIKHRTKLPDDFVVDGVLNREKYVIEIGFNDLDKWYSEFDTPVHAEIIGAIVIGSNAYNNFRYRLRRSTDEKWDLTKTFIGKLMSIEI